MTVHELMKLIDAGYTKDEIQALSRDESEPATAETEPEPEQPAAAMAGSATDPEPEPEQKTAEPEKNSDFDERLSGIEANIAKMMKMVQHNNLLNDSINTAPAASLEAETDKIMAEIIRPNTGRKE